jgi:hypothetical protein
MLRATKVPLSFSGIHPIQGLSRRWPYALEGVLQQTLNPVSQVEFPQAVQNGSVSFHHSLATPLFRLPGLSVEQEGEGWWKLGYFRQTHGDSAALRFHFYHCRAVGVVNHLAMHEFIGIFKHACFEHVFARLKTIDFDRRNLAGHSVGQVEAENCSWVGIDSQYGPGAHKQVISFALGHLRVHISFILV